MQADTGIFHSVTLSPASRRITINFAPPRATAAGRLTYDVLRLRLDKLSVASAARPGNDFILTDPTGVPKARGAWEIPAAQGALTATVEYS